MPQASQGDVGSAVASGAERAAAREVLAAGDGFAVTLGLPALAVERAPETLPRPDVSRLPGAALLSVRGWDTAETIVRAGCVGGPSSRYAPGIEDVLFEKATWMTLTRAGLHPEQLGQTAAVDTDRTFQRTLEGVEGGASVRIEHALAFDGPDRSVLFCSALCRGEASACKEVTLVIEGASAPPPRPSLVVRSALLAAEMPMVFFAGAAALVVAAVALILWRRPYPRP